MRRAELIEYCRTEEHFFEALKRKFPQSLSLYCVTGSLARGEIIPCWSDIDVLLAFEELSADVFEGISESLLESKSEIKIGLSVFSDSEVSHSNRKLVRTMLAMNDIVDGTLTPRLMKQGMKVAATARETILQANCIEYARALHDYKRSVLDCTPESEVNTYKLLILLIKILLTELEVAANSYSEVLEHVSRLSLSVAIQDPQTIIRTPSLFAQRKMQYAELVEDFTKRSLEPAL